MRAVVQRVSKASVSYKNRKTKIGKGYVVLLAAHKGDTTEDADYLADKIVKLRILADDKGLMNKSIIDQKGEILVISQFTLYARTRKGNRPSFIDAEDPKLAGRLYNQFIDKLKGCGITIKSGSFGSYMQVSLINDGPVTIIIDSKQRRAPRNRTEQT